MLALSEDGSTLALTFTTLSQCDVRQLNVRQSDAGAHIGTHVNCVSIARLVVAASSVSVAVSVSCGVAVAISIAITVSVAEEGVSTACRRVGDGTNGVRNSREGAKEVTVLQDRRKCDCVAVASRVSVPCLVIVAIVVAGRVVIAIAVSILVAVALKNVVVTRTRVGNRTDDVGEIQLTFLQDGRECDCVSISCRVAASCGVAIAVVVAGRVA